MARISKRVRVSDTLWLLTIEHVGTSKVTPFARCKLRSERKCIGCEKEIPSDSTAYSPIGGAMKGLRACVECVEGEGDDSPTVRLRKVT